MQQFGGKQPGWGYSESVLVDGSRVLCTPGGPQGSVGALDKLTGDLLWQTKEFTEAAQYVEIAQIAPGQILLGRQWLRTLDRRHEDVRLVGREFRIVCLGIHENQG